MFTSQKGEEFLFAVEDNGYFYQINEAVSDSKPNLPNFYTKIGYGADGILEIIPERYP